MVAGVIGDEIFIENIREEFEGDILPEESLKMDFSTLLSVVANWYEIDVEALRTLGSDRRASQIRAVMAHLARNIGGVSIQEVAKFCGRAKTP